MNRTWSREDVERAEAMHKAGDKWDYIIAVMGASIREVVMYRRRVGWDGTKMQACRMCHTDNHPNRHACKHCGSSMMWTHKQVKR